MHLKNLKALKDLDVSDAVKRANPDLFGVVNSSRGTYIPHPKDLINSPEPNKLII